MSAASEAGALPPIGTPEYFEHIHRASSDPFGLGDRWYEHRKRAVLLAMLPSASYKRAFEAGCSIGALSIALADRCEAVVAMDLSDSACAATRRAAAAAGKVHVEVQAGVLPGAWPEGTFDLVVLGEVGYYLGEDALAATFRAAVTSLEPAGHLVAVHWRHPIDGCRFTGDGVHARLRAVPGLVLLARYEEEHFLVDVLGREGRGGLPNPS